MASMPLKWADCVYTWYQTACTYHCVWDVSMGLNNMHLSMCVCVGWGCKHGAKQHAHITVWGCKHWTKQHALINVCVWGVGV